MQWGSKWCNTGLGAISRVQQVETAACVPPVLWGLARLTVMPLPVY